MKRIFRENNIPTSKYVEIDNFDEEKIKELRFPLIVKPVDAYSSRGVCKTFDIQSSKEAFEIAKGISRTNTAIIEEFVEGDELTVDVYVENGEAKLLSISKLFKIGEDGKFVIHRVQCPADITKSVEQKIKGVAQGIASAFGLINTPMLVQLITNGEDVSVIEFCARTGGGDKFRLIEKVSGFDVVKAVADLTLGGKPHYDEEKKPPQKFIINEFLYCNPGILDHLEGFEKLLDDGIITEYYTLKSKGYEFKQISNSGDRVAYYTVEADTMEEAWHKHNVANEGVKALSLNGEDLIRHDIVAKRK